MSGQPVVNLDDRPEVGVPGHEAAGFDLALLQHLAPLFTHRYCFAVFAALAHQPECRQALWHRVKAGSNDGLDKSIGALRTLRLIERVINPYDDVVYQLTALGRQAISVLNGLSDDVDRLWPDVPRKPRHPQPLPQR